MTFFSPEDDVARILGADATAAERDAKSEPFVQEASRRLEPALMQIKSDYRKGLHMSKIRVSAGSFASDDDSGIAHHLSKMIEERTGLSCYNAGGTDSMPWEINVRFL